LVAVVFDWDGTIVNSSPLALENFLVFAVKYFGVEENTAKKAFLEDLGDTFKPFFRLAALSNRELSAEETYEIANKTVDSFYEKRRHAPMFADVPAALSKLKEYGYDLCVSSGSHQAAVIHDAKARGLDHYFTFILGTKDSTFRKGGPHFSFISEKLSIKPRNMVFVGDGSYDMKASKNYGCFTIGRIDVLDEESLLASGADVAIRDFSSLPKIIREHFS